MLNLLAVAAREAIGSRLNTITSSVACLFAIDTLDLHAVYLGSLFLAELSAMTKLCPNQAMSASPLYLMKRSKGRYVSPLQLLHLGMPRSMGIPASFKRSMFSSGEAGHP